MTSQARDPIGQAEAWRLKLGGAVFAFSILLPVAGIPLVANLGLSAAVTASISGAALVVAELLGLAAVAIMGKPGYVYVRSRIARLLKRYGPPQEVGRTRYTIGLVMFAVPLLFAWIKPYAALWIAPLQGEFLIYAVGGDILLLASLFVLGGDFWDKVRALFVYSDKICRAPAMHAANPTPG